MNRASGLDLLYPYEQTMCSGQIKQKPEDFKVTEQLGFEPSGEGEHLLLFIQKASLTTHQLISAIAEELKVSERHIGYCGLKDKHAVTQQWLSIQLPGVKDIPSISESDQIKVLHSYWHDRKLRVGSHKSNSFEIIIRNVTGSLDRLDSIISQIKSYGFANYFGEQRFGMQQDNVEQAIKALNNRHKSKRLSRTRKSLYISSLRSQLFNQILKSRIDKGIWLQAVEGDICMLAGSQSVFLEAINDDIQQRYREFDIHSGISLYGSGESRLNGLAAEIEQEIFLANPEICETLEKQNIKRSFRANRAEAKNLKVNYLPQQQELQVQVELDRGSYLTTLLNHFISI